jgi:SAM-dependent methyltransferase
MLFRTTDLQLLKEAADKRAKNSDVSDAVSGWFEGRTSIDVLDLHAGTGATLRALAPLLAQDQAWTLYARDAAEEALARDHLTRWDPSARATEDGLLIDRQGQKIAVRFKLHDVVAAGGKLAEPPPSLVVIDDDLMRYPAVVIRMLVAVLADRRSVMHARLIYDGRLKLMPHHAADGAFTAALHRRFMRDAGYGEAMGPQAANELSEQLRLSEYSVIEGPSHLHLRAAEAPLIRAVQKELAEAQRIVAKGHDVMIDAWLARPRVTLEISQTDLVGVPT